MENRGIESDCRYFFSIKYVLLKIHNTGVPAGLDQILHFQWQRMAVVTHYVHIATHMKCTIHLNRERECWTPSLDL